MVSLMNVDRPKHVVVFKKNHFYLVALTYTVTMATP